MNSFLLKFKNWNFTTLEELLNFVCPIFVGFFTINYSVKLSFCGLRIYCLPFSRIYVSVSLSIASISLSCGRWVTDKTSSPNRFWRRDVGLTIFATLPYAGMSYEMFLYAAYLVLKSSFGIVGTWFVFHT